MTGVLLSSYQLLADPEIPDAPASGRILPIPAKSPGIPRFPAGEIPAQSGSGKFRLFSRPNRRGTGRGFGDFGVCAASRRMLVPSRAEPAAEDWQCVASHWTSVSHCSTRALTLSGLRVAYEHTHTHARAQDATQAPKPRIRPFLHVGKCRDFPS